MRFKDLLSRHLLPTALGVLCAALGALAPRAQEPVILNQRFELAFDRWTVSRQEPTSSSSADYDFVLGAPVGSYRLGAVAVMGTLGYDRMTIGPDSSSSAGLNRYGIRLSLFPYRRFHLNLDFTHTQSPSFFGAGRVRSNVYGLEYRLLNRRWPSLDFVVRRGDTSASSFKESWTQWTLLGDRATGRTTYGFELEHQDFTDSLSNTVWNVSSANAHADTMLNPRWRLMSTFGGWHSAGSSSAELGGSLAGPLGAWTSVSNASLSYMTGNSGKGSTLGLSQSFSRVFGQWTYFGQADVSASRVTRKAEGSASSSDNTWSARTGTLWQMTQRWTLSGDVGIVSRSTGADENGNGQSSVVHVGISQGGTLPDFMRQSLFFLSNLTFDRRICQDYPPGYLPSDLAEALYRRRMREQGAMSFAADYWHLQDSHGGRQDWFRVSGNLQGGTHFRLFVMGDLRKDMGYAFEGRQHEDKDLSASATWTIGRSILSGSFGLYRTTNSMLGPAREVHPLETDVKYATVGFNSILWRVPYGVMVSRYDQGDGKPLTTYSAYGTLAYGRLAMRVLYDYGKRPDGWTQSRISFNLLRAFDSVVLWGMRPRY